MAHDLIKVTASPFDSIRRCEDGQEYWSARDLQKLLDYVQWRQFEDAIERAIIACKNSGQAPSDHFADVRKMVQLGSGSHREVEDYHLTRYACYLVAMNSDPRKGAVSQAQTYFALKTREAELAVPPLQTPVSQINSLWQQRLEIFNRETRLPAGYWCVYGFVAGQCWMDEFRAVYLIEEALPDGSIGKRWCQHLREEGYAMNLIKKYPHRYPDKRGVQWANIYPNAWLGAFWTWFHDQYLQHDYPEYLKTHMRALPTR